MNPLRDKIVHLKNQLRKREREYRRASGRVAFGNDLDRNRYEGISTASRWAAEDLEEILKQIP